MLQSMALRLSTKQVLSRSVARPWNQGRAAKVLERSFTNGRIPTNVLSPSRGRISWIGTLSDKTSNGFSLSENRFKGSPLPRMLSTSSPSSSVSKKQQDKDENDESLEKKPQTASFQSMIRQYGKVFITTYFAVYISTILGLFMSVQSGQIDAMYMISLLTGTSSPSEPGGVADPGTIQEAASAMKDLVELLESYTITRPVAPMVEEYPWTANFAIAWIATKFTEPIRFGATVVLTPPIARFFGYRPTRSAVQKGPIDVVGGDQTDEGSLSSTTKQSSSTR